MVLRDRDGSIRGFHNVCRHRGARLLDGSGNCPATITCPYHGMDLSARRGAHRHAVRESFPGSTAPNTDLRPVRTDIAFGFVFVCLTGDHRRFSKIWGKLADEFLPYRFEEMVPWAPLPKKPGTSIGKSRWTITSSPITSRWVIPACIACFTPDYEDQASVPGIARGVSWLRKQESTRWAEGLYQRLIGQVATHLPEDQRRCWRFYSAIAESGD